MSYPPASDSGHPAPAPHGGRPGPGPDWPERDAGWPEHGAGWSEPGVPVTHDGWPEPGYGHGYADPDPEWPAPEHTHGLPAVGGPSSDAPADQPPAKQPHRVGRLALRIGLALIVGLGVFAIQSFLFGDKTRNAAVGDCVATGEAAPEPRHTEAEIVDCGSGDAQFTVVGRVNGQAAADSPACDRFFQPDEQFFVYASEASGGYLLCLKPKT